MKLMEADIRRIMSKAKNDNIQQFVSAFNAYSDAFGLTTKLRVAHFLGQIAWESSELNDTVENLNYSADGLLKTFKRYFPTRALANEYARQPERIANRVYANRMGNGSEQSGDGWKYRGRGLIMITGRQQYKNYEQSGFCNGKLTEHPEWLTNYPGAVKSAMWFWYAKNLNKLADNDDALTITKRINGGTNGYSNRLYYLRVAKRVLGLR